MENFILTYSDFTLYNRDALKALMRTLDEICTTPDIVFGRCRFYSTGRFEIMKPNYVKMYDIHDRITDNGLRVLESNNIWYASILIRKDFITASAPDRFEFYKHCVPDKVVLGTTYGKHFY
jgi:hypothetical protein